MRVANISTQVMFIKKAKWHAQIAQVMAEKLGCELVTFPGYHGSFLDQMPEWAAMLPNVLHKVQN